MKFLKLKLAVSLKIKPAQNVDLRIRLQEAIL